MLCQVGPQSQVSSMLLGGGGGYKVGDVGTISGGDGTAKYIVLAVGLAGHVTSIGIVSGGSTYSNAFFQATTPLTGSGNSNLIVDILTTGGAVTSIQVFNYAGQVGCAPGDNGTINVGNMLAVCTVATVNAFGTVLTVTALGGAGYPVAGAMEYTTAIGVDLASLLLEVNAPGGVVASAAIMTLFGGNGYAPGDTGLVVNPLGGPNTMTYTVLTVDAYSSALTVSIGGNFSGYPSSPTFCTTIVSTGSGDGTLDIDYVLPPPPPLLNPNGLPVHRLPFCLGPQTRSIC